MTHRILEVLEQYGVDLATLPEGDITISLVHDDKAPGIVIDRVLAMSHGTPVVVGDDRLIERGRYYPEPPREAHACQRMTGRSHSVIDKVGVHPMTSQQLHESEED